MAYEMLARDGSLAAAGALQQTAEILGKGNNFVVAIGDNSVFFSISKKTMDATSIFRVL
jgi:hypothetical protein